MHFILILVLISGIVHGVPLESPSQDLSRFFLSSRIVGGDDAPYQYLRYQAALGYGRDIKSFMCGGSIISDSVIMTAAHCIDPFITWTGELIPSFHARVGTKKWDKDGMIFKFTSFHNHPQWDPWTIKNDVGVLRLESKIQFGPSVGPLALGRESNDGGEKCYVTGWGVTEAWGDMPKVLQLLYVDTISTKQCEKAIRKTVGEWGWAPPIDGLIEICTYVAYGQGMCHGDSGSALVSVKSQSQIGIVSWGFPCAIGAPDVYTRIDGQMDFLASFINEIPQDENHK